MAVTDGSGSAIVIWQDTRSSGKQDIYNIYAQKIKITGAGVDDNQGFVDGIKLYQNFPNPFNNSTTISFNLAPNPQLNWGHKKTQIKIYNVKGQLVKQLKLQIAKGKNIIEWDGRDSKGKSLSNGIYFYRLVVGNFESEIRKMVILR